MSRRGVSIRNSVFDSLSGNLLNIDLTRIINQRRGADFITLVLYLEHVLNDMNDLRFEGAGWS